MNSEIWFIYLLCREYLLTRRRPGQISCLTKHIKIIRANTLYYLLCDRPWAKYFTNSDSLICPHNNSQARQLFLSLSYKWGKWGTEWLNNFPRSQVVEPVFKPMQWGSGVCALRSLSVCHHHLSLIKHKYPCLTSVATYIPHTFGGPAAKKIIFKVGTCKNQMERYKGLRLWLLMGEKYLRLFH